MATTYELRYRLPQTEVVVSGTHAHVTDQIVGDWSGESVTQLDIAVQTAADLRSNPILELSQGFLSNHSGAVTQHTDGRLASARRSYSGQGTAVVKSLATLAGTVVRGLALAATTAERPVNEETGDDLEVSEEYADKHRMASDRRSKIASLQRKAHEELVRLAGQIVEEQSASAARARLAQVQSALACLDSERRLADLHFEAWRAGTRSIVENRFELRIPVAELPVKIDDLTTLAVPIDDGVSGAPSNWRDLWLRFEIGLLAKWQGGRKEQPEDVYNGKSTTIQARRPDHLMLQVIQGRQRPTVLDISHHLAADEFSTLEKFDISKNIFRDKSLEVTFDTEGMLIGVSSSSTSALSGVLQAATSVPDAFTSGAKSAEYVRSSLFESRRASANAELTRLRQEIKVRQERVVAAGAGVLPEDAAELLRLQHAQSILDAQIRTSSADPALVGELTGHLGSRDALRPPSALEIRIDGGTPVAREECTPASGGAGTQDGGSNQEESGRRNPAL